MHAHQAVHRRAHHLSVATLALAAVVAFLAFVPAAHAAPCDAPVTNPVACENSKPGVPESNWRDDGDDSIQGYATAMSVKPGDTINFKIKSATSNFHIDILRLGYYNGDGARMIQSNLTPTGPSTQPACQTFSDSGLIDCGNWSVTRSWTVPTTAVSGVYLAHLVRNDTGGDSHILFVVRDDSSHSDVVVSTSDATWEAYNGYGGNDLYKCSVACPPGDPRGYKAAYKVSYNKPLQTEGQTEFFTGAEYSMIRFLEANGYNTSYLSSVDVAERGSLLLNHKLFISSGHDEYWSGSQRASLEAARAAGVNEAFFSGNEGFWKTRWEPSADGTNTPDRTLVSYKDTHFDNAADHDPVAWTGAWDDPRFVTAADGVTPQNALTGQLFTVNSGTSRITVPYAYRQLRMWRNTAAANLSSGQTLQLAPETLGYEWDSDVDNGFRPAGAIKLSATTVNGVEVFTDYGSTTQFNQTATHNMTMYKAPSGARVFGAGTVQWAWGLSDWNGSGSPPDPNMEQATVNLFADMGAQPGTLQSGLVRASATTDTTAPTASISSPPTSVADGAKVTLTGTASDTGGVVAGVEVSTDGGSTWHPATGTTSWTYAWIAHGTPSATIKVRATDDSGNIGTPTAGATVNISCPCSLWGVNVTPSTPDAGDPTPVEVGVKFTTDKFGTVSGLRFYKSAANTGVHIGSLWTASGQRLAQATFTNETASGWQTVTFDQPVEVQPNTTYVASYQAPNGHYAATQDYFYNPPSPGPQGGGTLDSAPLHAVHNTATVGNGVYAYSSTSTFPTDTFGAANYWVDVVFAPTSAPGQVTGVSATEGGRTSANVTWTAPATGGKPTSYKITPYIGSTPQSPTTVDAPATAATITGLTTGTTYRFSVQAVNPNGSGAESALSNAVTPSTAVVPSAPSGVTARPASQRALVTWTAAAADGDSAITGQTVTPYVDGVAQSPVQVGASATSTTISNLQNGTSYTFRVSATNGVGTGPSSPASNAVTPESTLFDFTTPNGTDYVDRSSLEIGVKFKADYDGTVTGVRFYKGAGNTGSHVGSLWTASGTRLAQATFTNETSSGWQSVTFATPVAVTAGTTYVASYFSPAGGYTATAGGLTSAVDNGPLHALSNSTSPNGVYSYGATSTFPSSTYDGANYWVDVLYALPSPGQVTNVAAKEGGPSSANLTWTPPAGGGPVTSYRITPYIGSTAQPAKTVSAPASSASVTGLTSGTTYTFRVQAVNANGPGPESAASNAVTPLSAVAPMTPTNVVARPATKSARVTWTPPASDGGSAITSQTVTPYVSGSAQTPVQVGASATSTTVTGLGNGTAYTFKVTATNSVGTSSASQASDPVTPRATIYDFADPATADSGDVLPVELGVKFKSSFDGTVTGVRFYKGAGNTGTHIGSLWTASGTRLAQATFTNETDSGWQTAIFSQPVAVNADTTYVASYFAPNGHYAVTSGGLSSPVDNGPLEALANSASPNGVYVYGPTSQFPTNSYNAGSYMVDVLFQPADTPGPVTGVTATAGQASATVSWTAPTTGGRVTSYTVTPYIGSTAQQSKTITGSPPATSTTINGLTSGTAYTFTVRASNPSGDGPESAQSNSVTPAGAVAPSSPTAAAAQADAKAAIVSWKAPTSDGGSPITSYTVTPFAGSVALADVQVDGSATATRITGLTDGTSYTFTVKASNAAGTSGASGATNAVIPLASIFDGASPAVADSGDSGSVVLGVKFTSDVNGTVTGIRFHKAAANTGTHVGSLWTADGTLLAQANFTSETSSGWQAVSFASPVPITAGTTYVAAYLAPNGHYSVTSDAFRTSAVDNPPLHALANATSPNGVYLYSGTSAFPTNDFNAGNYWVDVLFAAGGGQ